MSNSSPLRAASVAEAAIQTERVLPPVVAALDQATAGKWSFEVISHETVGDETVVVVRLVVDGRSRAAFGGTVEKGRLAHRLHAASLDALSRAAGLMGIAVPAQGGGPATEADDMEPAPGTRITRKQLDYLLSLARERQLPRDKLAAMCLAQFRKKPEYLTRAEASRVIESLKEGNP